MEQPFTLTVHMVASLDGFIAKPDNSVSWFETSSNYAQGESMEHLEAEAENVDCYVMGSATYLHALELSAAHGWVYGQTPTLVMSSRPLKSDRESVSFFSGSLTQLLQEYLPGRYARVWMVGGPRLLRSLLQDHWVDEIRVILLPIVLGAGRPYFEGLNREIALELKDHKAYRNGMVELVYRPLK